MHHHRDVREVILDRRKSLSQERILELLRELLQRQLSVLPHQRKDWQRFAGDLPGREEWESQQVDAGKRPGCGHILVDRIGVFRSDLLHMPLKAVDVGVDSEREPIGLNLDDLVVEDEVLGVCRAEFPPYLVYLGFRPRTCQMMDAPVDGVPLPLPRRADAARLVMHLKDHAVVPVHPRVRARRETCDPGPYNDYGLSGHRHPSKSFHHLNNDAEEGHCHPKSAN